MLAIFTLAAVEILDTAAGNGTESGLVWFAKQPRAFK